MCTVMLFVGAKECNTKIVELKDVVTVSMLRKEVSAIFAFVEKTGTAQITRNRLLKQLGSKLRVDRDRMMYKLLDMQIISVIPGTSPPCFAVNRHKIVEFFMGNPTSDGTTEAGSVIKNLDKESSGLTIVPIIMFFTRTGHTIDKDRLSKALSTLLPSVEGMEVPQISRNKLLKQLGGKIRRDKERMVQELLDMQIISAIHGTSPPAFAVNKQKIVEFFMDNPNTEPSGDGEGAQNIKGERNEKSE